MASTSFLMNPVSTGPGETTETRTPEPASSSASAKLKGPHCELAGRVDRLAAQGHAAGQGGDVHDGAAAPALHLRHHQARQGDRRDQVDGDDVDQLFHRPAIDRAATIDARGVDQDVDPIELIEDALQQLGSRRDVRNVGRERERTPPGRRDLGDDSFQLLGPTRDERPPERPPRVRTRRRWRRRFREEAPVTTTARPSKRRCFMVPPCYAALSRSPRVRASSIAAPSSSASASMKASMAAGALWRVMVNRMPGWLTGTAGKTLGQT